VRTANITRTTKETDIKLTLNIDGTGKNEIATGIGFFDHMLTALAVHAGFDLTLTCKGDTQVDGHHTVEDCGIAIGQAIAKCTEDKTGIARYGTFTIPMDESIATASADVSGRPYLVFKADFRAEMIGDYDTQLTVEFFRALATNAGITLHINAPYGENDHHKTEAIYKAAAHALKEAVIITDAAAVLSTKGMLA
jgi:imidazoleglycerol-phosphate dehydratase